MLFLKMAINQGKYALSFYAVENMFYFSCQKPLCNIICQFTVITRTFRVAHEISKSGWVKIIQQMNGNFNAIKLYELVIKRTKNYTNI